MSGRRNGLRKQVTEAKEGPLEPKREKGKGNMRGGKEDGERKRRGMLPGGRVHWVLLA